MKIARVIIKTWGEMEDMEGVEVGVNKLKHKDYDCVFDVWMADLAGLEFVTIIGEDGTFEVSGFTIDKWMYDIIDIWEEDYERGLGNKIREDFEEEIRELKEQLIELEQKLEELDRQIYIKNNYIDLIADFIKWEV